MFGPRTALGCLLVVLMMLSLVWSSMPTLSQARTGPVSRSAVGPVINELLYDPTGTDADEEFVELFETASAVDLEGWSLTDQDGTGPDIVFHGIILPSKGFLVVSAGTGTNDTDLSDGIGHLFLGKAQGVWSNTGDDCLLSDPTGRPVDYLSYGEGSSVDPPPANFTWKGTVPLVPEGYSIGRSPDGNGTASLSSYRPLMPTLGKSNIIDPPPVISDWNVVPEDPEGSQDILVWAKVTDDVRVDLVQAHLNTSDGTNWDQDMAWAQQDLRYEATVKGRPGGDWLNISVVARDPIGQTTRSASRKMDFKANISSELSADIHGPEGSVMPGEVFKITGEVSWANGSKASGRVIAEIPGTRGSWNASFKDFIDLRLQAPLSEGTYDIDITIRAGGANVTRSLSIDVGWPHKSLLCSLATNISQDQEILTGQDMALNGSAWFSDGLPAKSAEADIVVHGTGIDLVARTDDSGSIAVNVKAPSMAGDYQFEFRVSSMGKKANASVILRITDRLSLSVQGKMGIIFRTGENITLSGQVRHHDATSASNILIVAEVIGTDHKVKVFTGPRGNFSLKLVAPFYKGEYTLRVTAIGGDATSSWTSVLYVNSDTDNDQRTPGWGPALVITGVVLALGLYRRRYR